LLPARELLADTLLVTGKPAESLAEYEVVMKEGAQPLSRDCRRHGRGSCGGDDKRARAAGC